MAHNTLIRVVTGAKKPIPRHFTFKALTGKFYHRLEKVHGKVEVTEICISNKTGQVSDIYAELTSDELRALVAAFPHLKPTNELPPEPKPLKAKKEVKEVTEPTPIEAPEAPSENYADWDVNDLKQLLKNNSVKFDGRLKNKEKLIAIINENNL